MVTKNIRDHLNTETDTSGGSRISPRRGRQLPGGAPTYDFAKNSQKLHEIERIWAPGGGRPSKILLCRSATGYWCGSQAFLNSLFRLSIMRWFRSCDQKFARCKCILPILMYMYIITRQFDGDNSRFCLKHFRFASNNCLNENIIFCIFQTGCQILFQQVFWVVSMDRPTIYDRIEYCYMYCHS